MPRTEALAPTFEQAVLPHLDAAYNLARWLVRDAALAEDVAQDAMLRALQHFGGFRGEGAGADGGARAWLLRIVRNAAYDAARARGRVREVPLDPAGDDEAPGFDVPDPAPGPEAMTALRQDIARLDDAIAALPIELRECLILCEIEGLSYKEIARVTDAPIGTVMSRLWRARQALLRTQAAETKAGAGR